MGRLIYGAILLAILVAVYQLWTGSVPMFGKRSTRPHGKGGRRQGTRSVAGVVRFAERMAAGVADSPLAVSCRVLALAAIGPK